MVVLLRQGLVLSLLRLTSSRLQWCRSLASLFSIGLGVLLVGAPPASASSQLADPIEGRWSNPKRTVIIQISRCGEYLCGTVVWAAPKAIAAAQAGGTSSLVGARLLSDIRTRGTGTYTGRAIEPKRNIRAAATIRVVSEEVLNVRGCAFGGMICREQAWVRLT